MSHYVESLEVQSQGWFRHQIHKRLETGRNVLGAATGDLGSGKTYWCLKVAEVFDPDFNIDSVVFTAKAFLRRAMQLKARQWIVYDEPGVTLSNRTFMSQMNMITSYFLQSSRYRQINALFALPSLNLMDIAARTILLFQANIEARGVATVYRIVRNQFGQTPPFWTPMVGIVKTTRPSLGLLEAYEAKRKEWHESSFNNAGQDVEMDKPEVPAFNLLNHVKAHRSDYLDKNNKVSVKKILAKHEVGMNSAYRIKAILEEGTSQ